MAESGPDILLQIAMLARLDTDEDLAELVEGRIYNQPPDQVQLPYIRIGNNDPAADRIGCYLDTLIRVSIECHTDSVKARTAGARIAFAVQRALDGAALDLPGYSLDWLEYLTQVSVRSSDGKSFITTVAFEAAIGAA